jgi:hemerythrin
MELLEWSDKFISGNNLIDTQHEILMKECKEILSLIMQDNHDNSYVLEKIIKLSRKIEEHFFDEEKILLDKNFTIRGTY